MGTMSWSYFEIKRDKLLFTINYDKTTLTIKNEKMNEKKGEWQNPLKKGKKKPLTNYERWKYQLSYISLVPFTPIKLSYQSIKARLAHHWCPLIDLFYKCSFFKSSLQSTYPSQILESYESLVSNPYNKGIYKMGYNS